MGDDALQLNLGDLDLTSDEFILDEVDIHIQENLEDALVKEALKTGVDLRQYSKQVELELQQIEHASIKDYIKESQNISSLHNQITACDTILERMEQMLSSFQCDLSSISSEIQTLQEQSITMNIKLKNRQSVRSELSQLVDEMVVPTIMISTILDTPVTEQEFLEQLHELNTKINYVKEQLIFLINNYDMLLGVLMERAADESKEVESFQQLLTARTQEFIEEILSPPFGGMIAFVKESESLIEKGQLDRLKSEEGRVVQLVRGFAGTWKQSVENLSQDVMRSFTNFKNGTGIIQGALTQLIQYYHRFHKVLSQAPFKNLPVRSELINIHHLMVEVKKHKPNF